LDDLFDADRSYLILGVVVGAVREFRLRLDRFHNDSLMVHQLSSAGGPQHVYQPNLTRLQKRVLRLLGIQPQAYRIGME
jgi:hypothetical protein